MTEAKQPGRVQAKVQKHGPWVAIATAAVVPFFTYLQATADSRAAKAEAHEAQHQGEVQAAKSGASLDKSEDDMAVRYRLIVRELDRVAMDSDACHERVDLLAEEIEDMGTRPRSRRGTPRITEQRAIERPAAVDLPSWDEALE
jgi:hypothetical protein